MQQSKKMVCTECGREMNLHAEKINYGVQTGELKSTDAYLGGVLEEVHTCPGCGHIATRRAQ